MSTARFENEAREELLSSINEYADKCSHLGMDDLLEDNFSVDIEGIENLPFDKLQLIANFLDELDDTIDFDDIPSFSYFY